MAHGAPRGLQTQVSKTKRTDYMGLSENSVPLNPMVLLIIIPIKWLFSLGIYPIFRQTHMIDDIFFDRASGLPTEQIVKTG